MKIYTADRETGTFIDEIETIKEGNDLILKYEAADKENDSYEPNFYAVVDENHCEVRYTVILVGGEDDGKVLGYFGNYADAINFASEHEDDDHAIAVLDECDHIVTW